MKKNGTFEVLGNKIEDNTHRIIYDHTHRFATGLHAQHALGSSDQPPCAMSTDLRKLLGFRLYICNNLCS